MCLNGGRQNPSHMAKLFVSNGFFMDYEGSGCWDFRVIEVLFFGQLCLCSCSHLCACGVQSGMDFVPAHITIQKEDDEGQTFSLVQLYCIILLKS